MPSSANGAQIASVCVAVAASVISLAALLVAALSSRAAHRSVAAAEKSARQAVRSADAAEQNVSIARREEERRAADRREAQGPRFESKECTYGRSVSYIRIQMLGGPGAARLTVRADELDWLYGFTNNREPTGQEGENPFVIARVEPSAEIEFTAHLGIEPSGGEHDVILPLTITASYSDLFGEWTPKLPVRLLHGPRSY